MNNKLTKDSFLGNIRQYTMLLALGIIILFFYWLTNGKLLVPMNVSNLIAQNAYVVILATGMLICILTGGNIDLAVGSVVALIGACAASMIITMGWNIYLSVALCVMIGIAIGAWQGFWIAYVRIPAFIVTLSGMLVFRGITLIILNGLTIAPFPQEYLMYSNGFMNGFFGNIELLGMSVDLFSVLVGVLLVVLMCGAQILTRSSKKSKGYPVEGMGVLFVRLIVMSATIIALFVTLARYKGIPTVLVILGVLLLVYSYLTQNTVMGRHIYALGGNEKAARLSGVKTKRLLFLAYVNMSMLAAVAGLVFAARLNSASPQAGQSFELDAIGACYIGGASAYGGIGTVPGTLIGALIMGVLNNGMSIAGVNSNVQQVVKGLVLLAAVAFDVISKQHVITLPKFLKFKKG